MDYSMNDIEEEKYIFEKCKVKSRPYCRSMYLNGKDKLANKIISGISIKIKQTKRVYNILQVRNGGEF